MLSLLKYHSRFYRFVFWAGAVLLGGAQIWRLVYQPSGYYLADPFSSSIIATALITGALFAANYAYTYFTVTRRKVPPIDRGRFDDVRVQGNGYGEFIARGYGKFRTAGILIDATEITHTTSTTPGQPGGKGTPKPPTPGEIKHVYTTTLAVAVCEGLPHLTSDLEVTRIWENVEVIYDTTVTTEGDALYEAERAGNTLAGGAAAVADASASGGQAVQVPQNGSVQFNNVFGDGGNGRLEFYLKSTVANSVEMTWNGITFADSIGNTGGEYALGEQSGVITLTAGFTNTFKIKNLSATPFTLDYLITRISGRATGALNPNVGRVGGDENDPLPFHGHIPQPDAVTRTFSTTITAGGRADIRIYTGTETQTPDSALVALHGSGNTPAYRGTVYVVFDSYSLKDPYIPNFTFEINTGVTAIDDIVTDLYSLVGVDSSDLDVTALSSDALGEDEGFLISSREQAGRWLEDLQTIFQFDMVEVDGKVKAVKRSGSSAATVAADQLRTKWGDDEPQDFEVLITDIDEAALPAKVEVGYMDPLNDFHNNVQEAKRGSGNSVDVQAVNVPAVLTASHARQLAETILYQRHQESRTFDIRMGPKALRYHPGDVLTVNTSTGTTHTGRIVEQKIAIMGPVEMTLARTQSSVYTQTLPGSSGSGYESHVIPYPANTRWLIIDTALLRPEDGGDGTQPVVYVPACVQGSGTWRGAFLHKEVPADSGSYEVRLAIDTEASIGVAASGTAGTIDRTVWDRDTSVVVDFYPATTLSGVTELQAMNNPELNLLAIGSMEDGWYLAQFTTVSSGSASAPYQARYTISGFLWDRFGTGAPPAGSLAGLDVVILNAAVRPMRVEIEDVGRPRNYKMTSSGQVPADIPEPTEFTLAANSLKPPAPANLRGERDSDDNLLIEWERRGRVGADLPDFAGMPLAEETEEFVVEVYDGATLVRSMTATTGMSLAALLESSNETDKFTDVTVNTISQSGGGTVTARSFQTVTHPGNFVEATLTFEGNSSAELGVIQLRKDWRSEDADYRVRAYDDPLGPNHYLKIYEGATEIYSREISAEIVSNVFTTRVRITLSGSEIRFTENWVGAGTPPLAVSSGVPEYPFRVKARAVSVVAGELAEVGKVVMTTWPHPKTIYTAAQQAEDGLTPGDPVTVRVYQRSALVGLGHYAEATI